MWEQEILRNQWNILEIGPCNLRKEVEMVNTYIVSDLHSCAETELLNLVIDTNVHRVHQKFSRKAHKCLSNANSWWHKDASL